LHRRRVLQTLALLGVGSASLARAGSYADFFSAIQQDNADEVRHLLARGFDPNTVNESGQTGLFMACSLGSNKVVKVLLAAPGIEPEVRNKNGESALMLAAIKGETELVKLLVDGGADVNKTGWTPLHYAASSTSPNALEIARYLLDNAAYIDAESPNGTTPLMMAAMYGSSAVLNLLLDEGADASLRNQQGLTAIDFAQRVSRAGNVEAIAAALRRRQPRGRW
jgi:ankyrin repeat protein